MAAQRGHKPTSRSRDIPYIISLVSILIFISAGTIFAEQLPVNIKAEDLRYDDEHKIIIASGNVHVSYESIDIAADHLEMDTGTQAVTASGSIRVSRDGIETKGETLVLDIRTREVQLSDFSLEYHTTQLQGKAYMYAQELATSGNMYFGYTGGLTTCSLKEPHYWLAAHEFRYYPEDHIEGYHVTYHFSFIPVPVLYTPYYRFDLGKRKMIMLMPVIGQNTVEGFFVRNEIRYFIDEATEGSLYIDHLEKKGIGRGFKYAYGLSGPAAGSIYVYNVNEKMASEEVSGDHYEGITQNYITKFRQRFELNDHTELSLAHNYTKMYLLPSGYKDATDHDIDLKFNDDWRTLEFRNRFNLDYQTDIENIFYSGEHVQENMNTKLTVDKAINPIANARTDTMLMTHTQTLDERWSLAMSPRFYQQQNEEQYPDQRLDIPITLTNMGQAGEFYKKLTIEYVTYVDPDGSRVTADDHVEYLNKLPLTTLQLNTLDLDIFNVDTELAVGILEESKYLPNAVPTRNNNRILRVTRYTEQLTLFRDIDLPLGNTLSLKRYIRQVSYDVPGKHYRISDQPAFRTRWWDHLEHEYAYIYTTAEGESPIYYEAPQYDHENRLKETLRLYHENYINWKFSGGLNYEIVEKNIKDDLDLDPRDDFLTDLQVNPFNGKYLTSSFSSGWSYQQELWRDFVTAMTLLPNREDSWTIRSVYDINVSQYKSASSLLKFHVGRAWWDEDEWQFWTSRWAFSIEHIFDPIAENIDMYSLGIHKDLHCWTAQFSYTKAREEWVLSFSLKAFPDEPLSITGNDSGYSIDAFRKSLENPGVTRY